MNERIVADCLRNMDGKYMKNEEFITMYVKYITAVGKGMISHKQFPT